MTRTYPRSVAKFIRRRKSEIRRQTQDVSEQEKLINELLTSVQSARKTK